MLTRILTQGPIPRVEIARRTGLSQAAVTKAVAPLIEAGFVTDQPAVPAEVENQLGIGRPVSPLTVVRNSVSVIGLKVTPTALIGVTTDFTRRDPDRPAPAVRRHRAGHGDRAARGPGRRN